MAQLDRFLSVMVANGADSINLTEREVATLQKDGAPRPITKQPLTAQQLLLLLREIAPPDAARQLAAGAPADFHYANTEGHFAVTASHADGRWQASIGFGAPDIQAGPSPDAADGAVAVTEAVTATPPHAPPHVPPHVPPHNGVTGHAAPGGVSGNGATATSGTANGAPNGTRHSGRGARVEESVARPAATRQDSRPAAVQTTEERAASALAEMDALLRVLVEKKASDLHLRCGESPLVRIDGEIVRLEGYEIIENDVMEAMLRAIMPGRSRQEYADTNDTDFAYEIGGLARFRCNALRERRGAAGVFRVIPTEVVTVEQLGISPELQQLCQLNKGLVLVTGPTGSGKSTTLCAMIDLVNRIRKDHVITIEDPIEFVHRNKQCMITQRQVGQHTTSFKSALRAALREDPDIILVGELRDLETVLIAIETAEPGHLVFGTLHTSTAASTVDRVIDQFSADRQEQIRVMLAESLKGVIAQTLCAKIGGGRVAAREVLLSVPAISNLIREGKTFQIPSVIQTSRRLGMITLTDALIELVNANVVEPREAYAKALDKTSIVMQLKNHGHDVSFVEAADGSAASAVKPAPGAQASRPAAPQRPAARK
jgi:twitching motility protein PilT